MSSAIVNAASSNDAASASSASHGFENAFSLEMEFSSPRPSVGSLSFPAMMGVALLISGLMWLGLGTALRALF